MWLGDDAAAIGGNFGDHLAHLPLEDVEFGEIGRGIGDIGVLAGRVGGDQRIANIGDIDLRVGDRLPGVRIRPPVVVIMAMVAGALARLDAFGGDHDRRFGAGGLDQPLEPTFEAEPVHEDELGIGSLLGVARRGRIDVGIAVGTDQSRDRDIGRRRRFSRNPRGSRSSQPH